MIVPSKTISLIPRYALYKARPTGSIGDAGCFGFYPSKNLGAFGDGRLIVTDGEAVWEKVRMLRDHGQLSKNSHDLVGFNTRLDSIQAAIFRVKLKKLDEWNNLRRAAQYKPSTTSCW